MPSTSLDKSKIPFLLLEGIHPSAVETLEVFGYTNIDYVSNAISKDELKDRIATMRFLGIRSRTQINDEILDAAKKLVAIGCFCIGTNQVDLQAATRRGIPVFNAPYSNTRSVAELVLAEAIMLLRGIPNKNSMCHKGKWKKLSSNSYEIRGKKLGIIGYGNIGSQLSILAESMGMKVFFYDISTRLSMGNATQIYNLNDLLEISDIISLHVPETTSTQWMIGQEQIDLMKDNAVLINASRGTVVDIHALADALHKGKLLGAAIDVFPEEPQSNNEEFVCALQGLQNVILTPHVGGSTQEAQQNIGREVAEKLSVYSDNGTTLSSTNFPEVALPDLLGKHRLLHIHRNMPGVISDINQVFSENDINISRQYLQTNDLVGYVAIDVESTNSDLALEKLRKVDGTLRCRILY
ncbi:MAG: phosphoglycerate dehydrogenase [Candidatus Endonucleobacter bathymodioli]|uniref:D-3-phosphoglycerate dehydrogenase n=1 Tax=Candidatus Endonucleibacter bathymodioli TaxID=539814 RepID=A0AA90SWT6_9GAMM|nr:phosphoglycerate dehydrogenase [Candidatus Endonucleobacter bathymodioli]